MTVREVQKLCHDAAYAAGWWHHGGLDLREEVRSRSRLGVALAAEKLALVHSETSEALEGLRKDSNDDHLPDRKTIEVELADAVIRILDLAGALNLDIAGAMEDKMAYNLQRADHKPASRELPGGKAF